MDDIINSKVVIMYGIDDLSRSIKAGEIENYGKIDSDDMHILSLIDFIKDKYSDVDVLNKININHQPEVASYLLTRMFNHIVFLNTTSNEKKYGKTGIILLPDVVDQNVFDKLNMLALKLDNFNLMIYYNLYLENGILKASSLMYNKTGDIKELLENCFDKKNKTM